MVSTTIVDDVEAEVVLLASLQIGQRELAAIPAQRVAIHEECQRSRRCHHIAIHVRNIADGDIDTSLVDTAVHLIDIDHQLMSRTYKAEVQFAQFLEGLDGCTIVLVNISEDIVSRYYEDGIVALTDIAIIVAMDDFIQSVWFQEQLTVLLALLTTEVEIGLQSFLLTAQSLTAIALNENCRQCLLEERQTVNLTCQGILLVTLVIVRTLFIPYHVTQIEVVTTHSTDILRRE